VKHLKVRSCLIDGAMCRQGVVVSRLSAVAETSPAFLCTFDLLELLLAGCEFGTCPSSIRRATAFLGGLIVVAAVAAFEGDPLHPQSSDGIARWISSWSLHSTSNVNV
jgi:hypothetical protein